MKFPFALISALIVCSVVPLCATSADNLAAGPMLGHVDMVEAHVWLQTKTAAQVFLRYKSDTADAKIQQTETLSTGPSDFHIALFEITDLLENTHYSYELFIDNEVVSRPYATGFTTRKFWRYRSDPPELNLMFGSCFYTNDPYHDRPGKPYGRDFSVFPHMVGQKADAMFWLGDNTYLRESDFFARKRIERRYAMTRAHEAIQPLLASTANYAIWDDHDFGPNDSNRAYAQKDITLNLFQKYWNNPSYGMPDTKGTFGLVTVGDVDLFLMDNRYNRAPEGLKDPNRDHFGRAQMQWLKDSLVNSRAPFKLIVAGSQMINRYTPYEAFTNYPGEHAELMYFLKEQDIRGVVFVSGDRHHSELIKLERPDGYPLYEFTCSPMTAGMAGVAGSIEENNPLRVANTLVADKHNFGIMQVTGPRKDRVLTMKIIDRDGVERWSHSVSASTLK